jgi:hypothetical protein
LDPEDDGQNFLLDLKAEDLPAMLLDLPLQGPDHQGGTGNLGFFHGYSYQIQTIWIF